MACTVARQSPSALAAQDAAVDAAAALCIFFDLETTGLDPRFAEVIEIAAVAMLLLPCGAWHRLRSPSGAGAELAEFQVLVTPSGKLPKKISRLTGISNERLSHAGHRFATSVSAWQLWLQSSVQAAESLAASLVGRAQVRCWLVGHNALGFDLPFLVSQHAREQRLKARSTCGLHSIAPLFEGLLDFVGVVDTLRLSRCMVHSGTFKPPALSLQALHNHVLKRPLAAAHTALGDARGLAEICRQEPLCHALVAALSNYRGINEQRQDALLMGVVATLRQAIVTCSHRVHVRRRSITAKLGRRLCYQDVRQKCFQAEHDHIGKSGHPTHQAVKLIKEDCAPPNSVSAPTCMPCMPLTTCSNSEGSQVRVLAATAAEAVDAAAVASPAMLPNLPSSIKARREWPRSQYLWQERHLASRLPPVAAKHRRWRRQTLRPTTG